MTVNGIKVPGWFIAVAGGGATIIASLVSAGVAAGITIADRKTFEREHGSRLTVVENKVAEHNTWATIRNADLQSGIDALVRLECLRTPRHLVELAGLPCQSVRRP